MSRQGGAELVRATIGLLGEMEGSLHASQQALLAGDLTGIEQGTRQQIGLRKSLEILGTRPGRDLLCGDLLSGDRPSGDRPSGDLLPSDLQPGDLQPGDRALAAELGRAQMRVLQLGQIQAALLTRARRWSTILSNLLAGPDAGYVPSVGNMGPECGGWPQANPKPEEEPIKCRA
jgi:hypothetical protein